MRIVYTDEGYKQILEATPAHIEFQDPNLHLLHNYIKRDESRFEEIGDPEIDELANYLAEAILEDEELSTETELDWDKLNAAALAEMEELGIDFTEIRGSTANLVFGHLNELCEDPLKTQQILDRYNNTKSYYGSMNALSWNEKEYFFVWSPYLILEEAKLLITSLIHNYPGLDLATIVRFSAMGTVAHELGHLIDAQRFDSDQGRAFGPNRSIEFFLRDLKANQGQSELMTDFNIHYYVTNDSESEQAVLFRFYEMIQERFAGYFMNLVRVDLTGEEDQLFHAIICDRIARLYKIPLHPNTLFRIAVRTVDILRDRFCLPVESTRMYYIKNLVSLYLGASPLAELNPFPKEAVRQMINMESGPVI